MGAPGLKLVTAVEPVPERPRPRRLVPLSLGLLLVGIGALATLFGADAARHPLRARELASATLQEALERGNDDARVVEALIGIRRHLGRHPLDSRARVVYAGLLLGLSRRVEDVPAAVFHARRAAELAPVTVPVVRSAAGVLAHAGEAQAALAQLRGLFGFDPDAAAEALSGIEPLLLETTAAHGVPESPEAWLAWSSRLGELGRTVESEQWLRETHERWPDHLPALERLAAQAVRRGDWTVLATLFPADRRLPDEPGAVRPLLYRARWAASRGDLDAARADIKRAMALGGGLSSNLLLAGDAYDAVGDPDQARRQWNRALFALPGAQTGARAAVLLRLARLEDRHGRPGAALRLWESVLAIDPEHVEARGRVDDLSGFER